MSPPPLLSAAAGTGRQSRSASKVVFKAASGFHVFRIEGYSLTKTIPGGEKISSNDFSIGGRSWRVDLYPNGTDGSKDESDSIALFLVYLGEVGVHHLHIDDRVPLNRLSAQYKFCLLDAAGNAAYELPAEKGVFNCSGRRDDRGCGHDTFISRDELEGQRAALLLKDDCLAIRCDVGVVGRLRRRYINIRAKRRHTGYTDTESSAFSDTESSGYSDDSCFDTNSDNSRSSRRRNKRRRHQTTLEHELALLTKES